MKYSLVIARRDLAALFLAPVAYVVTAAFLAVQGLSFWSIVRVLADPKQSVGYGAVLEVLFGGSVMFWMVLFTLVALITMRLCAEERRQGTWESLLTTRVSELDVLTGKWLAGLVYYIVAWAPTALFIVALFLLAPGDVAVDAGPIASAYLGVFLCGAAFLAIGVAVSSATDSQLVAAAATFGLLAILFFAGQLQELWGTGSLAEVGEQHADVGALVRRFALGQVSLSAVLFFLGLAVLALFVGDALAIVGRRSRRDVMQRVLTAAAVSIALSGLWMVAVRHGPSWDWTRERHHTLSERTERVLDALPAETTAYLIRPARDAFFPVYEHVERLLLRMRERQPLLVLDEIDAALSPERIAQLSERFAVSFQDLVDGGAVFFESDNGTRVVELLDMASFGRDGLGRGAALALRAEDVFASALWELSATERTRVCYTRRHGELPPRALSEPRDGARPDWRDLAAALERDAMELMALDAMDELVGCDVLLTIGAVERFSDGDVLALDAYVRSGGQWFVALASRPEAPTPFPTTGFESVLSGAGLRVPHAFVMDPTFEIGQPLSWTTSDGYADHAISSVFRGRRASTWVSPRPVLGGQWLVRGSAESWGESDPGSLQAGAQAGSEDLLGAPPVAAVADAGNGRIVVFGSARSISSHVRSWGQQGATALAATSISWLAGRVRAVPPAERDVRPVRLVLTAGQLTTLFWMCGVTPPLGVLLLGTLIGWRRRRS